MCLSAIMPLLAALMWVYKEDVAPSMHGHAGLVGPLTHSLSHPFLLSLSLSLV
jgi:hypothetical protein